MKRICIIVLVVLTTIIQVNAQVPNDTTIAVQDTTTKVVMEQKNNLKVTVKPSRKREKNNRKEDDCDCKQCQEQLDQANSKINRLEKEVVDLNTKFGKAKALLDIDDRDFYRSLITTPLEKKYDSIEVDYYKKTAAVFDHENKKEMKWVYEVYYPLLENYGKYNEDLAKLIRKVIRRLELPDAPNSKTEKAFFNEDLEEMEYFKKYRYKSNISQEIKYLETVINDTKLLFDNPSKFKKENFEEQLRRLEE